MSLVINKKKYQLKNSNYISEVTEKKRIIIGNTHSTDMRHYIGWNKRLNGDYKKTAMFTVCLDGKIYQHFSPNNYSLFMDDYSINETSITIVLENEGWLVKDLVDENKYINHIGHIYNRKDSIMEKRWRNQTHWAPYSNQQIDSTCELVKRLCLEFNIPFKAIGHNTNFDSAEQYDGILYKSNFGKYYMDISPAWDCLKIKNRIEN